MRIFFDGHIHSRFSRATSKNITIENLEKYARIKGINVLGTGDFGHPLWFKELKEKLTEDDSGILKSKTGFNFILSNEISNIYTQNGKQRRVHNIIFAPNFEVVEGINAELLKHGRLDYDGRPIFGFTCPELVEIIMSVSDECMIIPAHMLTPWYSIFGSMSGFDSVEECFQDQAKYVYALETGLSSDSGMDWRISTIDNYSLVSFSDSHSANPWRLGREACVFDLKKLSYKEIADAIKKKDKNKFLFTIEYPPTMGKYHWTGHRKCGVSLSPKEALKINNICPVCHGKLTVGVEQRVEKMADRPEGYVPENAIPFKNLIPLCELIKTVSMAHTIYSKTVWSEFMKLVEKFGDEFNILLNVPREELEKTTKKQLVDMIMMNREGKVHVVPGYDGVYGIPVFSHAELEKLQKQQKIKALEQKTLNDFRGPVV